MRDGNLKKLKLQKESVLLQLADTELLLPLPPPLGLGRIRIKKKKKIPVLAKQSAKTFEKGRENSIISLKKSGMLLEPAFN